MPEITASAKGQTKTFRASEGQNLLSACLDNKVRLDHVCRTGLCGMCQVLVTENRHNLTAPTAAEVMLLDGVPLHEGVRLACQAELQGSVTVVQPKKD